MGKPLPLTDEQEQTIVDGFAAGLSRNEIARRAGVSTSTVSARAKAAGHSFDRTATAVATVAAQVDHAERRTRLRDNILTLCEQIVVRATSSSQHQPQELAAFARALQAAVTADEKLSAAERDADASPMLEAVRLMVDSQPLSPGE